MTSDFTCHTGNSGENRIDRVRPDAPALAGYGTFPVGVRTLTLVNPGQIDIVNTTQTSEPLYDRPLTVEIWYPAVRGTTQGGAYRTKMRDGQTDITLLGRANRDAAPDDGAKYPLIVISHGYPGNRYLLSHLGETLASRGYVTVAIDHTDSTYSDQGAFGSTLYNRPLDQRFIIDQMAALGGELGAITDTRAVGVIGYSMGAYGAMVFGGAGVTPAATTYKGGTPNGLLNRHLAGSASHTALVDDRVKAVIPIGPWGMNNDFWDTSGLKNFKKPLMLIAGGVDDVSEYAAIRQIFAGTTGTSRQLLTFEAANHAAAAPIPAPIESWEPVDNLDFVPFEHYADAVWDTNRMNNITQHFATAFMDLHLKGDADKAGYLDLFEYAADGSAAPSATDGKPADDTYWRGFPPRTAQGLRFETRQAGT